MKTLLLSLSLLVASPLALAQNSMPAQTTAAMANSMPGLALDARTRARLGLALKAGHAVSFLNNQGGRVARAVLDPQGLAQVIPDGAARFDAATQVTITGGCASQRYALIPSSSTDAVLMVRTGDRAATLASVLSTACTTVTGNSQAGSNAQANTSTPSPSMIGTTPGGTTPGAPITSAPGQGDPGGTAAPAPVLSGGVSVDAATTVSLTTALKAGLGVTLLDAGGRVVARTTLSAQGQAQLVRTGAGAAVRVSITDPRNRSTRRYPLIRATGSLLVSVPGAAAGGAKAGTTVTLASVLKAGTAASTSAPAVSTHATAVQLDTGTTLGLTTALKAGRTVVFIGAQEQVVAHAVLDAQGRAQIVTDGAARLGAAVRVMISDTRNNAKQSYALIPSGSTTRLLVAATAGKTGNAASVNLSLASVLNAPLIAQPRTGVTGTVAVAVSSPAAAQNQEAAKLDAVTGVRLAAALKAGRTVVFLGAEGQVVAHAALDAQSRARIITDGAAKLGTAVRVTIGDARNHASQSYALVPGSATNGLLVVTAAGKGNGPAQLNVSLASVLNGPLVSQSPAVTPKSPDSSVSVGAAIQTPGQATGGTVPAGTSSAAPSQGTPSSSVSAGASVQTPVSSVSVGASGTVSAPAAPSAPVSVGVSVGTSGTTAPSAPAVGISVGISGGGSSSAPAPVTSPAPVTAPVPLPINISVPLPVPLPLPGVGGGSGGIGIGIGVGVGGR